MPKEVAMPLSKLKALLREVYFMAYNDGQMYQSRGDGAAKRAMDNLICFNDDDEIKTLLSSIGRPQDKEG